MVFASLLYVWAQTNTDGMQSHHRRRVHGFGRKPFLLSVAFQKWCSGAVQNCAEIIALLADNDTVKGHFFFP